MISIKDRYILFCNDKPVTLIENTFKDWCIQNNIEDYLIVKSNKKGKNRVGTFKKPGGLKQNLKNFSNYHIHRVVHIDNVNSEEFIKKYLSNQGRIFGITVGFNQIFQEKTIQRFFKLYNFHLSLLPYYRGPTPTYWCMANGEEFTGISIHEVTAEIDKGPIIWQKVRRIETKDIRELNIALLEDCSQMLIALLDCLHKEMPIPITTVCAKKYYKKLADYYSFPKTS